MESRYSLFPEQASLASVEQISFRFQLRLILFQVNFWSVVIRGLPVISVERGCFFFSSFNALKNRVHRHELELDLCIDRGITYHYLCCIFLFYTINSDY